MERGQGTNIRSLFTGRIIVGLKWMAIKRRKNCEVCVGEIFVRNFSDN
jgi:hypothetical protein